MSKIRTIKPEFCTSQQVVNMSTTARLLFVTMWMFCDDHGVHPASVRSLKMECFPGDSFSDEQMLALVDEMISNGLLLEFENNSQCFWQVTGWNHQRIDKARTLIKYPTVDNDASTRCPPRVNTVTTPLQHVGTLPYPTLPDPNRTKEDSLSGPSEPDPTDEDFEELWTAWTEHKTPKGSKKAAREKWKIHVVKPGVDREIVIGQAQAYCRQCETTDTNTQHVERWIAKHRWEDDNGEVVGNGASTKHRGAEWDTPLTRAEERERWEGAQAINAARGIVSGMTFEQVYGED